MVAMLDYTSKARRLYDSRGASCGIRNSGNMQSRMDYRLKKGMFTYNGNARKGDYTRWKINLRQFMPLHLPTHYSRYTTTGTSGGRIMFPWFHRRMSRYEDPSVYGLNKTKYAYQSEHFAYGVRSRGPGYVHYKTTKVNGVSRNIKVTDWGTAIGGNINGRIAQLKWRGDLLWKP